MTTRSRNKSPKRKQSTLPNNSHSKTWEKLLDEQLEPEGTDDQSSPTFRGNVLHQWPPNYTYFNSTEEDETVFERQLICSVTGIIYPKDWEYQDWINDQESKKRIAKLIREQLEIFNKYNCNGNLLKIGWSDEADNRWEPFLLPWRAHPNVPLTPENLLMALEAHKDIQEPTSRGEYEKGVILDCDEEDDKDEDYVPPNGTKKRKRDDDDPRKSKEGRRAIQAFLKRYSIMKGKKKFLAFYAGSMQMNPVPCFAVTRVHDDLVAGFIGCVVHT